jgi:hypothetical protein
MEAVADRDDGISATEVKAVIELLNSPCMIWHLM